MAPSSAASYRKNSESALRKRSRRITFGTPECVRVYPNTLCNYCTGIGSDMKGSISIDAQFCKGCYFCIEFCPKGAIRVSARLNAKGYAYAECDSQKPCSGCGSCALVCPEAAIEVYRD